MTITEGADDDHGSSWPKHPAFAAHFRDPIYDDEADDFAPFGNDEGWDLMAEWAARAGELTSETTTAELAPDWFTEGWFRKRALTPSDLGEDDVDTIDHVIGAGFVLLRLTGRIDAAGRALVLRALDVRDAVHGAQPQARTMRTHLLAFAADAPSG